MHINVDDPQQMNLINRILSIRKEIQAGTGTTLDAFKLETTDDETASPGALLQKLKKAISNKFIKLDAAHSLFNCIYRIIVLFEIIYCISSCRKIFPIHTLRRT